jgi:trigger factor
MTEEVNAKVEVTEVSPVLREIKLEIPWESVRTRLDARFEEIKRRARPIKGFRKGKAPRWVLEQMYGPAIQAEVSQQIVSEVLAKAFMDHELAPVTTPEVEAGHMDPGQPLTLTVKCEVRPKLTGVTYQGLEVKRPVVTVKDEDVNAEVERLREEAASVRTPHPPRPARGGDVLVVDYEMFEKGSDKPAFNRADQELELGKGTLLDDVEKVLFDVNVGDERDAVVGPAEHQHRFHIKVKEIKEKVLPEVDDEFAKDVSEHETLLELRLALRAGLEKKAAGYADNQARERLLEALCDANPVEVPPSLVQEHVEMTQRQLAQLLQRDLAKMPFSDEETARIRTQEERKVRTGMLLAHVAQLEKIEVGDAEIEERLKQIAEETNQPLPKVKAQFAKEERLDQLRFGILQQRLIEYLMSKATVVDVPAEELEKQEKASAAPSEPATEEAAPGEGSETKGEEP